MELRLRWPRKPMLYLMTAISGMFVRRGAGYLPRIAIQASEPGRFGLDQSMYLGAWTDRVMINSMSFTNSAMAIGLAMNPSHPLAWISSASPLKP